MYKNKRFGWLVDANQLTPRQRRGSLIGGIVGITIGILIADQLVSNRIANFLVIAIFAAAGNILGMYLTRAKSP